MKRILVVVDMQKDFIDGSLGTQEAVKIVDGVRDLVSSFKGKIYFTRDTHGEDYLSTREGKCLPVLHCIKGTEGWQIEQSLPTANAVIVDKPTFGSTELAELLKNECGSEPAEITLVGLCTDICVISNALLLKATLPECEIRVISSLCAGVSPESHLRALESMRTCQITVV